jgi:hypothetical protein
MTGTSIAETIKALRKLDDEMSNRALTRKAGIALADHLDERVRDAAKTDAGRDEARKPFSAQTRRAQELAKAFGGYPALASRVVELLVTDIAVRRLAKSAYSSAPRDPGSRAVRRVDSFDTPLAIARPEILQKTILPRVHKGNRLDSYFPGRFGDLSFIERLDCEFDPDAGILSELAELSRYRLKHVLQVGRHSHREQSVGLLFHHLIPNQTL